MSDLIDANKFSEPISRKVPGTRSEISKKSSFYQHLDSRKKRSEKVVKWMYLEIPGTRWWQLKYFLFSSLPGEMIQFEKHIFQGGWFNHQLGVYLPFKTGPTFFFVNIPIYGSVNDGGRYRWAKSNNFLMVIYIYIAWKIWTATCLWLLNGSLFHEFLREGDFCWWSFFMYI